VSPAVTSANGERSEATDRNDEWKAEMMNGRKDKMVDNLMEDTVVKRGKGRREGGRE
jgi:hypothetical protein